MSRAEVLRTLVRRELGESLRSRWFVTYSAVFLAGAVALTLFGLSGSQVYGYRGFAKLMAGLVHLALLFVPLMALFPATAAIAGERETGSLEYLVSQPISFGELFWGKWLGVSLAVSLSLSLGFGFAGAVAVSGGTPWQLVALLLALTLLLAQAFVAIGLLCSALARSRARATSAGLILWIIAVGLGTLGLMGLVLHWGLPRFIVTIWAFANPVEAFRLGVIASLDSDGSLLGPVGGAWVTTLGAGWMIALCLVTLLLWTILPTVLAWWRFRRPQPRSPL
ncbi:MAG: ABC transporter permease subunit [Gemmatimonadota bacterium]|nr:MAG: ABC transporter permease subunit [Gemmatimonadota bacterium]